MAKSYYIQSGGLYELTPNWSRKYYKTGILKIIKRLISICIGLLCTWGITCYVYFNCITPIIETDGSATFKLIDCITTGSLFATFGSALIAVFTLFTAKYLTRFYDDVSILMLDLSSDEINPVRWKRWAFVPRINRIKYSAKPKYIGLDNATITFCIGDEQITFKIPTTESDIEEFLILRYLIQMKRLRKKYFNELDKNSQFEEYPAWDCVFDIYKCALFYRLSNLCVWIGTCFIMHSILFAFCYSEIYNAILCVCGS